MAAGLLLTVPSCSREEAVPPRLAGQTQVYRCGDGFTFVVRYERERAWLFMDGNAISAPQVPAGARLHYSSGAVTLDGDGGLMRLSARGIARERCVAQPDEVAWADARLRGVHVRAEGRGPDWVLEIREGKDVVFAGASGSDRRVARFPQARLGDADSETFEVDDTHGAWRITLQRAACEANESSNALRVLVEMDGRTLAGCGRVLR